MGERRRNPKYWQSLESTISSKLARLQYLSPDIIHLLWGLWANLLGIHSCYGNFSFLVPFCLLFSINALLMLNHYCLFPPFTNTLVDSNLWLIKRLEFMSFGHWQLFSPFSVAMSILRGKSTIVVKLGWLNHSND